MINIVLLGGPGAGKGTQAESIMRRYGIPQISTGEIFRENIRNGTELGKSAKSYMDRGALVPDEVTVNLVKDRLSQPDCANGYILDGFPRNITQAEALDKYLADAGCGLKAVVDIYVSDENIVGRLSGRRVCRDCGKSYHVVYNPPADASVCDKCGGAIIQRDDDREETVRERLRVYHAQTAPLIDYYQKTGVFMQITGRELVEDTTAEMFAALEAVLSK